jgi:4-amino-4-deoxy-L-arabinose transferase-like glycosyltransferase
MFSTLHAANTGETPVPRDALIIFALSLAMHAPWLAFTPIAGTEGHRIFPAHEMVRSGWWSVPILFGQPLLSKPPLHLWLIAIAEKLAGVGNVFVWRLPSTVMGAALCAAACGFAQRWFSRTAGWISGCCALGMIAIWGQSQVADIDSTNTLAAALTAFCGIELLIARPARSWPWVLAAGAAMAATLMTKGPGGLPIILGVWLWGGFVAVREHRGRVFRSIAFWGPIAIGFVVLGLWMLMAWQSLKAHHVPPDWKGVIEGLRNVGLDEETRKLGIANGPAPAGTNPVIKWLGAMGKSLVVLPGQLFAFALPISLALPMCLHPEIRRGWDGARGEVVRALVASVLISWCISVMFAIVNPRYGYPTLIPLCPLAGAVAVAASRGQSARKWLGGIAVASAILFGGAAVALAIWAWHSTWAKPLLAVSAVAAVLAAIETVRRLQRSWRGAWGLALLVLISVVPFSVRLQQFRTGISGINVAPLIRRVAGPSGTVAAGGAVTSKPETFYYAGVPLEFFKPSFTPDDVASGTWVVLDQAERKRWVADPMVKLQREFWLCRWGPTDYYMAWYVRGE